ncbi:MAG: DUF2631 domain-containing protein [Cumulibacter sp.]
MASIRKADHDSITHGSAHPASASTEVELADDDPRIWGWHHSGNGRGLRIGGFIAAIVVALMAIGNHEGKVEDLWLWIIAALMLAIVLISAANQRKSTWRK